MLVLTVQVNSEGGVIYLDLAVLYGLLEFLQHTAGQRRAGVAKYVDSAKAASHVLGKEREDIRRDEAEECGAHLVRPAREDNIVDVLDSLKELGYGRRDESAAIDARRVNNEQRLALKERRERPEAVVTYCATD